MKIAVIGATGATGRCVVTQALERGHNVLALVRSPDKLEDVKHENFEARKTDIFNESELTAAFGDVDAVISCLGTDGWKWWWQVESIYSETIKTITASMKASGKTRIIAMTSAMIKSDPQGGGGGLIGASFRAILGPTVADMCRMEDLLFSDVGKDLEFTIIRPTGLSNDELSTKEPVIVPGVYYDSSGSRIARANVAKVMLDSLDEKKWIREGVFCTMTR